jgi:hypothetical protein
MVGEKSRNERDKREEGDRGETAAKGKGLTPRERSHACEEKHT